MESRGIEYIKDLLKNAVDSVTGNVEVEIAAASVAVPVDIQFESLTAPLPVSQSTDASAYESITVADAAIGFTALTYGTATHAYITVETAQIRFRIDGTNPTSSEGHILNVGDALELNSAADLVTFKAIRTGAVSGVIKVTYSGVAL